MGAHSIQPVTSSNFYCLAVPLQDDREKKWRIQAVGVAPGSFDSRKALPAPWRGLRDAELRWDAWVALECLLPLGCLLMGLILAAWLVARSCLRRGGECATLRCVGRMAIAILMRRPVAPEAVCCARCQNYSRATTSITPSSKPLLNPLSTARQAASPAACLCTLHFLS